MAEWTAFPYAGDYVFDATSVKNNWERLHAGDAEPLPKNTKVLQAWALFHNGEFQKAADLGLKLGGAGLTVANKSACIYATYLETKEKARLELYLEVARRAGSKVKSSLENVIKLQPKHADAHIALGTFHAEVIDKVGSLIGGMTYGAKKETGLRLFQEALKLNIKSAIGMIEYANAMVMLEGDKLMDEATKLYQQAAAAVPMDAMERLDVEMARVELQD